VNRSQKSVDFVLNDPEGHLYDRCVSWSPQQPITLRPKEQVPIDVHFSPSHRIAPFKLPLNAQVSFGQEVNLLNVSGTCHAAEIKLSEHSLLFGDVVIGSTAFRKVHLHNFGDMGVKYRFDIPPKLAALFSAEPNDGFVGPHDDVVLQIKFHPTKQSADRNSRAQKIRCVIEDSNQHEPVELMVQGRGVDQPDNSVQMLTFNSVVREKTTKEFSFPPAPLNKNPTSEVWRLNPIIKTDVPGGAAYWSCPSEIIVPPGGTTNVEIVYRPLTMTIRDEDKADAKLGEGDEMLASRKGMRRRDLPPEKHAGNLFIATPDGSAFSYKLEGTALPPKDAKRISVDVQCKKPHIQPVEITNWLREAQRFNVKIQLVEPANAKDEIKLTGVDTFDLPADLTREYKFNVYAFCEGSGLARLTFTNVKTEEYMTIEVAFKFVAPDTLQTLEFNTTCRQVAKQSIGVSNPLSQMVSFKCEGSHPDIRFAPETFEVGPSSEAFVDVLFRPVLTGKGEATIRLSANELGDFPYTVKYDVKPAGLEKTMVFKAPLGSTDVIETFKFLHFSRKPASYTSRIEAAPGHKAPSSDFTIETKDIKAAASNGEGVEVSVDLRFQPSALGEIRALLVLSSPDGGDYKALLVGYTQPPQPQGPVTLSSGKPSNIDFNNPFEEATEFSIQIDNPCFTVANRKIKLDAKKSSPIAVTFKSDKPQGARLIISASNVSTPWIYFLKGVP